MKSSPPGRGPERCQWLAQPDLCYDQQPFSSSSSSTSSSLQPTLVSLFSSLLRSSGPIVPISSAAVLPHGFPIFSASVSTFPVHREFDLHAAGDKRDTSSRRVLADFLMPDSRCDTISDNRLIRSCEMVSGSSLIRKRCFWHFLIRRILR